MKRALLLLLALGLLAGCGPQPEPKQVITPITQANVPESQQVTWLSDDLTDVRTGTRFAMQDYAGAPVLVHTFATTCAACTQQQRALDELDVPYVAMNTDPDETAVQVREHARTTGASGRFTNPDEAYLQLLIGRFGVSVVDAQRGNIILVCSGQAQLLPRGQQSAQELASLVEQRC